MLLDVNAVANQALIKPKIYVPALVDEIQRLRTDLRDAQAHLNTLHKMCKTDGIWAVENYLDKLLTVDHASEPGY